MVTLKNILSRLSFIARLFLFMFMLCSCASVIDYVTVRYKHQPWYKKYIERSGIIVVKPDARNSILIINAIKDFVASEQFQYDIIFEVMPLEYNIDEEHTCFSIISIGESFIEQGITFREGKDFEVGNYLPYEPNSYLQFGDRVILYNNQDTSHKITSDLIDIISRYTALSIKRFSESPEEFYNARTLYKFRKGETTFYEKLEDKTKINSSYFCR